MQGRYLSSQLTTEVSSVLDELYNMTRVSQANQLMVFRHPVDAPKNLEIDCHTVLCNSTELVYKLPRNTSLFEVLGPVGEHSAWVGESQCYATLDPRPP